MKRRTFLKGATAAALAAGTLRTGDACAADEPIRRNIRTDAMTYRVLGRTNYLCSRLIFGCGAALAGGKAVRLLDVAFERGVNFFDVGSNDYYRGAENHLAPFLKRHRESVWVTSKGYARTGEELGPDDAVTTTHAKTAAHYWTNLVDQSLKDLDTDFIDAYYTQGANNPALVRCEELGNAFEQVKRAGKVGHIGVSTHQNAEAVLATAVETGWYDIAMIAITPAGWYDWKKREVQAGTPSLRELRPVIERAREAGLGLIGMKCARYIAPMGAAGKGDTAAFDRFYPENVLAAELSPFQRSYAYVLHHGLDAVNSDMQNFQHFEENYAAAKDAESYFA